MGNLINESTKINTTAFKPVIEVDLEWFEREALKKLFLNRNTTLDLETATFGKAFERVSQYVVCNMSHEVDYVADVCNKQGIWNPFSGSAFIERSVSITSFHENSPVAGASVACINNYISRFRNDDSRYVEMSELGVEPMELTDDVMEKVLNSNKTRLGGYSCDSPLEEKIPGEKHENVKITRIKETTVNVVNIAASKEYVLQGEYKGQKFEAVMFACDENKKVVLMGEPCPFVDWKGKGIYDIRKVEGFENDWWC